VEDIVADIVDEIEAMMLWNGGGGSEQTNIDQDSTNANNTTTINNKQHPKPALASSSNSASASAALPTVISTEGVNDSSSTVVAATEGSTDVVQHGVGAVYQAAAKSVTDGTPAVTVNVSSSSETVVGMSRPEDGDEIQNMNNGQMSDSGPAQTGNVHDEDIEMGDS